MIELVVAACLINQPSDCRDVHLTFDAEHVSLHQCMMYGQVELAKWASEHPGYVIKRWRCAPAKQFVKI